MCHCKSGPDETTTGRDEIMEKKKKFIIDIAYLTIIGIICYVILKFLFPILLPFIIAFLIASIVNMLACKLCAEPGRKKRIFSILFCVLFYVLVFYFAIIAGAKIFRSVSGLLMSAPTIYQRDIIPFFEELSKMIENVLLSFDVSVSQNINNGLEEYINNIGNYITEFSMNAVKLLSGGITSIPGLIVKLVIMIVSSFFMSIDYDKIIVFFGKCVPESRREVVFRLVSYVKSTLKIYVRSYSLLFSLTFVELCIGFKIIGIPYALAIGLLVAVFDILPVLGTGGVLLPWAVILFMMDNIPMGIGMIALYLVITVIRNTLEPRIVGKQIGLHPLATLIALYLGLNVLGFVGMFLFPVTLSVLVNMNSVINVEKEAENSGNGIENAAS